MTDTFKEYAQAKARQRELLFARFDALTDSALIRARKDLWDHTEALRDTITDLQRKLDKFEDRLQQTTTEIECINALIDQRKMQKETK